jgi:hypothetical protein
LRRRTALGFARVFHKRRRAKLGIAKSHFVEWNGKPVASVKTGFSSGVRIAGLDVTTGNVTPHTLRHKLGACDPLSLLTFSSTNETTNATFFWGEPDRYERPALLPQSRVDRL